MDGETKRILEEQQLLSEVLNHQGWSIARQKFTDKILALQNAFDIESATPTTMLRDLQARKKATEILFAFLRELEGAVDVVIANKDIHKTYIINNE
jgi:hypothetical protein